MATKIPNVATLSVDNSLTAITWSGLLNGDDGTWVSAAEFADRSIHFYGTFGAGGTVVLQGSNEDTPTAANAVTLADPQGTAISKTGTAIEQVLELTRWIRPAVTAGDGTTSLTATLFIRRPNNLRT